MEVEFPGDHKAAMKQARGKLMDWNRSNIRVGNKTAVVSSKAPDDFSFYQFGFTPFWAKKNMYVINARSEGDNNKENDPMYDGPLGITKKPFFRAAIKSQRCIIPVTGFIEGPKKEKYSKPYLIHKRDPHHSIFLAGIWDTWEDKEHEKEINTFAIMTTVANDLLHKVGHHRSPVVLEGDEIEQWMDMDNDIESVLQLLKPFDSTEYNAYRIDPALKSGKNKSWDLYRPHGPNLNDTFPENWYADHLEPMIEKVKGRESPDLFNNPN